ncbi:Phosphatidylinositol 3- and 4-kinase family [Entamoeba histolytica]
MNEDEIKTVLKRLKSESQTQNELNEKVPYLVNTLNESKYLKYQNEICEIIGSNIGVYSRKSIIQQIYYILPDLIFGINKQITEQPIINKEQPFYINHPFIPNSKQIITNPIVFSCGILKITMLLIKKSQVKFYTPMIDLIITILKSDNHKTNLISSTLDFVFVLFKGLNSPSFNQYFYQTLFEWSIKERNISKEIKGVLENIPINIGRECQHIIQEAISISTTPIYFKILVRLIKEGGIEILKEYKDIIINGMCCGEREDVIEFIEETKKKEEGIKILQEQENKLKSIIESKGVYKKANTIQAGFIYCTRCVKNEDEYEEIMKRIRNEITNEVVNMIKKEVKEDILNVITFISIEITEKKYWMGISEEQFYSTLTTHLNILYQQCIKEIGRNEKGLESIIKCLIIGYPENDSKKEEFIEMMSENEVVMKKYMKHILTYLPLYPKRAKNINQKLMIKTLGKGINKESEKVIGKLCCYYALSTNKIHMKRNRKGEEYNVECPFCDGKEENTKEMYQIKTTLTFEGITESVKNKYNKLNEEEDNKEERGIVGETYIRMIIHLPISNKEKMEKIKEMIKRMKGIKKNKEYCKIFRIIFRFISKVITERIDEDNEENKKYFEGIIEEMVNKEVEDRIEIYDIIGEVINEIDITKINIIIKRMIYEPKFYENQMMRIRIIETMKKCGKYLEYPTIERMFNEHRELDKDIFYLTRQPYQNSFINHFLDEKNENGFNKFIEIRKENILPEIIYDILTKKKNENQFNIDENQGFENYSKNINIRLEIYYHIFHEWIKEGNENLLSKVTIEIKKVFNKLNSEQQNIIMELLKKDHSSIFEHFLLRSKEKEMKNTIIILNKVIICLEQMKVGDNKDDTIQEIGKKYGLIFMNRIRRVLGLSNTKENVFGWNDGFNGITKFLSLKSEIKDIKYILLKIIRKITKKVISRKEVNSQTIDTMRMWRKMCECKDNDDIILEIALTTKELINKGNDNEEIRRIGNNIIEELKKGKESIKVFYPEFNLGCIETKHEEQAELAIAKKLLTGSKSKKVKYYILKKINKILSEGGISSLSKLNDEQLNNTLTTLIKEMKGNKDIEYEIGKIIGVIGAISPSRIHQDVPFSIDKEDSTNMNTLIITLLKNHLVPELIERGGDESLLFVIMNLLTNGFTKQKKVLQQTRSKIINGIMNNLPIEQQTIINNIINSYNSITMINEPNIKFEKKMFLEKGYSIFTNWVVSFYSFIISNINNVSPEYQIFNLMINIMINTTFDCQIPVIHLLFPIALKYSLIQSSPKSIQDITEEVIDVLEKIKRNNENSNAIYASQLLFETIDYLTGFKDNENIVQFLSGIDQMLIASTAQAVNSPERAYVLIENYLHDNNGINENQRKTLIKDMISLSKELGKQHEMAFWKRKSSGIINDEEINEEERLEENNINTINTSTKDEFIIRKMIRKFIKGEEIDNVKVYIKDKIWEIIWNCIFEYNKDTIKNNVKEGIEILSKRLGKEIKISYMRAYETIKLLHIFYDIKYLAKKRNETNNITKKYKDIIQRMKYLNKNIEDTETLTLIQIGILNAIKPIQNEMTTQVTINIIQKLANEINENICQSLIILSHLCRHARMFNKSKDYCNIAIKINQRENKEIITSTIIYQIGIEKCMSEYQQSHCIEVLSDLKVLYDEMNKKSKINKMIGYDCVIKKLALKIAIMSEENNGNYEEILGWYKKALSEKDEDEMKNKMFQQNKLKMKVYYFYAHFLETVNQIDINDSNLILEILMKYMFSLKYGFKYLYYIIPKIISLSNSIDTNGKKIMKDFVRYYPEYLWYPFLTLIISKLEEPNFSKTFLSLILTKVLVKYPEQVSWRLASSIFSRNEKRVTIIKKIIEKANTLNNTVQIIFNELIQFGDAFNLLAKDNDLEPGIHKFTSKRQQKYSILLNENWSHLIIPTQKALTINIPESHLQNNYSPFEISLPKIKCIENSFRILNSLQKPKKITILSKDKSEPYYFLCKGKDDIRKDNFVQELFGALNHLFETSHYSQQYNLKIQTYTALPMSEETGLIEWASNTIPMKSLIVESRTKDIITYHKLVAKEGNQRKRVDLYKKYILNSSYTLPPQFYSNFNHSFPIPHHQIKARENYSKSMAVMSMVGSIIGLGDRHLENILLNTKDGNIVHIDFDMLFWKGEILPVPETVPFRLTTNMIDCFGPQAENGLFLDMCTVVLKTLRHNQSVIISLTDSMLQNPFIDWANNESSASQIPEKPIPRFKRILSGIDKLGRVVSERSQAEQLINDAKSVDNLGSMFQGWLPYI